MERVNPIHNICKEFTEKIKSIILTQLTNECKLYKTNEMKILTEKQLSEVYLDILDKVNNIENQLNLYID